MWESGRTQRSIAEEVGIRPDQLSRIADGIFCEQETRAAIAAALKADERELFPHIEDIAAA